METRANYVAVGAFVLVLLAGAAGVLLWLIGNQFNEVVAYYEVSFTGSVSGLDKDSQVRYNGVPVGKVSEIDIDQVNPNHIRVLLALNPVIIIRSDAVATLSVPLISGGATIEITGGTNSAPPFPHRSEPPYPFIPAGATGLQSALAKAPDVLQHLLEIEDQLKIILNDKNEAAIAESLGNVRVLTGALAKHSADIDAIFANATDATHQLDETAKAANEIVQKFGGTVARLDTALGHADTLIGHTDKLIGNVNATVQENRPGLHDFSQRGLNGLQELIANANELVIKVGRVVDDLARDPSHFLLGDHNEGYQPK